MVVSLQKKVKLVAPPLPPAFTETAKLSPGVTDLLFWYLTPPPPPPAPGKATVLQYGQPINA
jgi:hypothetical protein